MKHWILDDNGEPVQAASLLAWADWMEASDKRRIVEQTTFECCGKWLSTVFLGVDHNFTGKGPPILFETMAFDKGGTADIWQDRYATRQQAMEGHRLGVEAHACG